MGGRAVVAGDREPCHIAGREIATRIWLPGQRWHRGPDAGAVGDDDGVRTARLGCGAPERAPGSGCQLISGLAASAARTGTGRYMSTTTPCPMSGSGAAAATQPSHSWSP